MGGEGLVDTTVKTEATKRNMCTRGERENMRSFFIDGDRAPNHFRLA